MDRRSNRFVERRAACNSRRDRRRVRASHAVPGLPPPTASSAPLRVSDLSPDQRTGFAQSIDRRHRYRNRQPRFRTSPVSHWRRAVPVQTGSVCRQAIAESPASDSSTTAPIKVIQANSRRGIVILSELFPCLKRLTCRTCLERVAFLPIVTAIILSRLKSEQGKITPWSRLYARRGLRLSHNYCTQGSHITGRGRKFG